MHVTENPLHEGRYGEWLALSSGYSWQLHVTTIYLYMLGTTTTLSMLFQVLGLWPSYTCTLERILLGLAVTAINMGVFLKRTTSCIGIIGMRLKPCHVLFTTLTQVYWQWHPQGCCLTACIVWKRCRDVACLYMLTFAFMHYPYLVCILFGMPSLHL